MSVNENHVDVAKYRGAIRECEFCANARLALPLRTHCKFCLTNGYLAKCLNCDGTGNCSGIAPWDGKSEHKSVCAICGGTGTLPARLKEFEAQSLAMQEAGRHKRPELVSTQQAVQQEEKAKTSTV
jgi:hypothetical protein